MLVISVDEEKCDSGETPPEKQKESTEKTEEVDKKDAEKCDVEVTIKVIRID